VPRRGREPRHPTAGVLWRLGAQRELLAQWVPEGAATGWGGRLPVRVPSLRRQITAGLDLYGFSERPRVGAIAAELARSHICVSHPTLASLYADGFLIWQARPVSSSRRPQFPGSPRISHLRPKHNRSRERGEADSALSQLELDLYPAPMVVPKLLAVVKAPRTVQAVNDETACPSLLAYPTAALGGALAQVLAFHEAFDLPRRSLPNADIGQALADLRVRLLREEVQEFVDAAQACDIVAVADALADIVYVAYGAAISYGIDLDAVVTEVHRANMSKLDEAGRPVLRADGKVLKSGRYRRPEVGHVLGEQLPLFDPSTVSSGNSLTG
jgi:predicted HAD superfamily Cof-like phosphohydrolase